MFTCPIRNFPGRTAHVKTEYDFMEENQVNIGIVEWKLQVVPKDVDNEGNKVISAKLPTQGGFTQSGGLKYT